MRTLRVIGAYGREANRKDWEAGADFQIIGGPYFSIRDLEKIKSDGWDVIDFYGKYGRRFIWSHYVSESV